MNLKPNSDGRLVIFEPTVLADKQAISDMPAFSVSAEKKGYVHFAPAKQSVIRNLIQRLKADKCPINCSNEPLYNFIKNDRDFTPIPKMPFKTQPLPHQEIALRFLLTNGGGGLLLDPGLGKTKVVWDFIIAIKTLKGKVPKTLVVCPVALQGVWAEERVKHTDGLTLEIVETSDHKDSKWNCDVTVISYKKASLMQDFLVKQGFELIVVDEGLIKNPDSQQSKACWKLGKNAKYRILLSGTLINNTPLDVYSPVRFIEPSLVGTSFSKFKNRYAIFSKPKDGRSFVLGFRKLDEIKSILHSCSIVMRKEEWLKFLPKKVFKWRYIRPTDFQWDLMEDLSSNWITSLQGNEIEITNAMNLVGKLAQISSGFMYVYEYEEEELEVNEADLFFGFSSGKTSKKKVVSKDTIFFDENPKLDALIEDLNTEFAEKKVILWYNYTAEAEMILKKLKEWGISHIHIAGGEKKVSEKISKFNSDETRVLLAQAKVINYGVTILGKEIDENMIFKIDPRVYTELFYSFSFSLEVFLQQQDRIHRIGQNHECFYKIYYCGPAERKIKEALEAKIELREEMLVDILRRMPSLMSQGNKDDFELDSSESLDAFNHSLSDEDFESDVETNTKTHSGDIPGLEDLI